MPEITRAVSDNSDDSRELNGTITLNASNIALNTSDTWGGFRFQNMTIDQGAVITTATFRGYISSTSNDDATGTIFGEDADNASAFTSTDYDITDRALTTASTAFDDPSYGTGWYEIDVTAIVQEIVNRVGWGSGNAIALIIDSNTSGDFRLIAHESTNPNKAELIIEYSTEQIVTIVPASIDLIGQQFDVTAVLPPQTVEILPAVLELIGQQFTVTTDNNQTVYIQPATIELIGQQFTVDAPITVEIVPATIELVGQQFDVTAVFPTQTVEIIPATIELIGQQMLITAVSAPTLIGHAVPLPLSATSQDATDHENGTHSHSAEASSEPGAAESLLKSNTDGGLTLEEFGATRITSDLIPELTDTYDLGTQTLLWRKGWLSELDTILFAQNTITLLGGWFMVSKDAGTLAEEVNNSQTQIDFGKTMTLGDFVILRQSLQVEYLEIGTLASGTTYNVTRNVDGSGANTWPEGAPFVVLGQDGDGRIELSAYDTPRISILDQGATYNAQTEITRLGDLDGNWGYTAEEFGIALGEYAADKANLTWDPTNGLRLRTHDQTVLQLDNAGNASIKGVLDIGDDGGIYQGGGTFASPTTGLKIWNESGVGSIAGFNAGDKQWWGETDGNFYFANGTIRLTEQGMEFIGDGGEDGKLSLGGVAIDSLFGTSLDITNIADQLDSLPAAIRLKAEAGPQGLDYGEAEIQIDAGHSNSSIHPSHTATSRIALMVGGSTAFQVIDDFSGGFRAESTALDVSGRLSYTGALQPKRSGTTLTGYAYVPLFNPVTHSDWDGDDHKTPGNYTLTPHTWSSAIPATPRGVVLDVRGQPTAANTVVYFGGGALPAFQWNFLLSEVNQNRQVSLLMPLNSSGQFLLTIQNANFNWFSIRITGFFI